MPLPKSLLIASVSALFPCFAALAGEETTVPPGIEIVVSIAEQKLAVVRNGDVVKKYRVSTSRYGIGDANGSYRTPIGRLKVTQKIGGDLPPGAVLKSRVATGEIVSPNSPGRDPIVSRILWLDGQEMANRNAHGRCVYIHGTPDEKHLGRPASYGCIRMSSKDVIELYSAVPVGIDVSIVKGRLPGGNPITALFAQLGSTVESSADAQL